MLRTRPTWIRGLRLYRRSPERREAPWDTDLLDDSVDRHAHVQSRFRGLTDTNRFALYSVHDVPALDPDDADLCGENHHTLIVVREFRRVPLDVSSLALALFTARAGCAAPAIATLAHWAERAVSLYQPAYLLLARSLEDPRLAMLLTGVHERHALQESHPTAFSVEALLPEMRPLLDVEPEWYTYCQETLAEVPHMISPYAV